MSDDYRDPSSVEWNFDDTTEVIDYETVPPGTYLCRVDEARPGLTRAGHTRWGLKFVVHEGCEVGRTAAWDGLTFSPKAASRTKEVLRALGLPHEGTVRLCADDLLGRTAYVTIELGEYRNPTTGQVRRRSQVPYGGVQAVGAPARKESSDAASGTEEDAQIPF